MSDIKPNRAAEIQKMYADDETNETVVERATTKEAGNPKKSKGGKVIFILILIVILAGVALYVISKTTNWDVLGVKETVVPGMEPVKASDWQAVFLSNGQVYFGKLKGLNDTYPTLEDVYYLQVQETPIQPAEAGGDGTTAGVQAAATTQQQLILVKFGTELHRPMDKMYLNKDHMMFFEDLSSASNVVTAITDYKKGLEATK
ncbi:MAG TPA: hypothetical protein PLK76_03910 [bacterium]|nr:hypothetical protein [bacterium]